MLEAILIILEYPMQDISTSSYDGWRWCLRYQDWLQVGLGKPTRFSNVKLYLYSNKEFGSSGNTYREPASHTVQYDED